VSRSRRIYGHKREEGAGGWRKIHNEELHNSYVSSHIKKMRWEGHAARITEMRNAYNILA
jgi:hypothetical protein